MSESWSRRRLLALGLAGLLCWAGSAHLFAQEQPRDGEHDDARDHARGEEEHSHAEGAFSEEIEVIGLGPLDHLGESSDRVPWTVHRVSSETLERGVAGGAGVLLEAELPGVHLSAAQGSSLQADVLYRGFGASPLLGANQGLSVYEDGVRVNEVFGDIVAWDLVPMFAAERIELLPGANPMFGLNTLGGAIALNTRSGFDSERLNLTLEGGSFGRRSGELSAGGVFGSEDGLGWFVAARSYEEDGWRDFSPSSLRQALAKLSQRGQRGHLSLTVGAADNELIGNGVVPVELLELDRSEVFTHPDRTRNDLFFPRLRIGRQYGPEPGARGRPSICGQTMSTRTTRTPSRPTMTITVTTRMATTA